MCGRYTLAVELDELAERFGCPRVELVFRPRYNVAPADTMPVITASDGNRSLKMMRWGLVPFWAEDSSIGYRMINARVETAAQKNRIQRCIPSSPLPCPCYRFLRMAAGRQEQTPLLYQGS